jgi:hypothetical protein
MNPKALNIKAIIKLCKINNLIRPTLKWCAAPGLQTAKIISTIGQYKCMANMFNMHSSTDLISALQTICISQHNAFCSFDITNIYTNTAKIELSQIIRHVLANRREHNVQEIRQILTLTKLVVNQHYFIPQLILLTK